MSAELEAVRRQMREDWNQRAAEDANYYVAFGRRNQNDDEFFATARDQVIAFQREMKRRLAPGIRPGALRGLEIGCGPGRLLRPMAAFFGEIHGVDVSDEMVRLANANLAGLPHAHAHHAPNSDLSAFPDNHFDFVYSYAVFQHIPSREVVFGYLGEAVRVMKAGGILRCQINGLPKTAKTYDTWAGVRVESEELLDFARSHGVVLLALEGVGTQYMWITVRKPSRLRISEAPEQVRIRRITNSNNSEPVAPVSGRFAALALWVDGLPEDADLLRLRILLDGKAAFLTYVGHAEGDGLQQVNLIVPEGLTAGLKPVDLYCDGVLRCRSKVRLIRPGPPVPRIMSLTDGIDLLSGTRIVTGSVKAVLEEVVHPERLRAEVVTVGYSEPGFDVEHFCTNPQVPTHELNFRIPRGAPAGPAEVRIFEGKRLLGAANIVIAG